MLIDCLLSFLFRPTYQLTPTTLGWSHEKQPMRPTTDDGLRQKVLHSYTVHVGSPETDGKI